LTYSIIQEYYGTDEKELFLIPGATHIQTYYVPQYVDQTMNKECSLKSLLTPKSPKGNFFKLLIFSSSPLGVRGKNGKNQQFEGFLYCTQ